MSELGHVKSHVPVLGLPGKYQIKFLRSCWVHVFKKTKQAAKVEVKNMYWAKL